MHFLPNLIESSMNAEDGELVRTLADKLTWMLTLAFGALCRQQRR